MAKQAAKKRASPPPDESGDDIDNEELYNYFATKVLPNTLTLNEARSKLNEKQLEAESKVQLKIIQLSAELNLKLKNQKAHELFKNHSLKSLYNNLTDLQVSQHFCSAGWKCVAFATCIPMTQETQIFVALVYHTRKCPIFFNWSLLEMAKPVHPDTKINPISNLVNDELQNEPGLVENFASEENVDNDWLNQTNLEDLLDRSNGSSIDSGKTIQEPVVFPSLECNDISGIDFTSLDDLTPNSYLDASFMPLNPTVKRRLNLSKDEKIKILELNSMTNKVQSTPRLEKMTPSKKSTLSNPSLHPTLAKPMKRTHQNDVDRSEKKPQTYLQKIIANWFKSNLGNLTADLKNELSKMEN